MEAGRLSSDNGVIRAQDNVRACFGGYILESETVEYDQDQDLLTSPGAFELRSESGGNVLRGDSLLYRPRAKSGEAANADIALGADGLHAIGKSLYLENQLFRAEDIEMTSCKPHSRDWVLRADSVEQTEDGVAVRGALLQAAGVPLMYLPAFYVSTQDAKRSGFLAPEIDYSEGDGGSLSVPYYFFLADNYDATIAPEWFSEHGVLWNGEFRYLNGDHRGDIDASWISDTGESRGRRRFSHEWKFARGRLHLSADDVSDDDYFSDFSHDSDLFAKRNLPRRASLEYDFGDWQTNAVFESFETVNYEGAPPHNLVPQLGVRYDGNRDEFFWTSEWELSRFSANRTRQFEGTRSLWRAGARRRWNIGGISATPELGFHAVHYSGKSGMFLEADDSERMIDGDSAFVTPYVRVRAESGDRPLTFAPEWTYQLRGVYAYSPENDQKDAPLFDSALREFSSGGIYDWNRFSGGDRAADANVAAYGADFRWWDDRAGEARLALELAQRYYLRRPRVTLPGESSPPERGFANLFASLRAKFNSRWRAEADAEWNPAAESFESVYADARADFGGGWLLRAGGLWEESESLRVGGAMPLGARADFAFLTRYLLDDDEIAESEAGLVVRGECGCWSLFLLADNLIVSEDGKKTSYSIGFEFKGLGGLGKNGYESIISDLR